VTDKPVPWNDRALSLLEENKQNLLYLAGGILVFFAIFAGVTLYFKNYEANALSIFAEANILYNNEKQKEKAQDYSKNLESFKKIATLYPRSKVAPFANMYLSEIYYNSGEFPKALESYNVLLQKELDEDLEAFAQYGMGKVYESMGKFDEALKYYEIISKKRSPLNPLILKDIGRLMEKLNRTEDAKSKYKEFVEMNPNSPFKTEIIYKISQL
jgi:predicted negative regulator of RcsB-dependent stress response